MRPRLLQRLRLRHAIFIALLLSGILPLATSSLLLIWQNREILEGQERDQLVHTAREVSREFNDYFVGLRRQLTLLGETLLTTGGDRPLLDQLRAPWLGKLLGSFMGDHPELVSLRLLGPSGEGPRLGPTELPAAVSQAMDEAFAGARGDGQVQYRFIVLDAAPAVVLALPVSRGTAEPLLVVEALARLRRIDEVFRREAQGEVEAFLIDRSGEVLWSEGSRPGSRKALLASNLVADFVRRPLNLTTEYTVPAEGRGRSREVLARVSPVGETGWGVVVQKPLDVAFAAVDEMVVKTLFSSLLLVGLALSFAWLIGRRLSQPIQRLAETSHEIAHGNFGRRVDTRSLLFELSDLGANFNRMSSHIESYIEQLRRAARANRDLFIGSLRAFIAAVDAKDPYTRGHSERVAAVSRTLGRHLGLSPEQQEKLWIAALLHDVGKIGVEDRILQKTGRLEPEEFEQMKRHTVIGAEIISPIEQLREMIPIIRWHHENWNGRGYPDGLRGEQIPLAARIVAVADTFDAITTNRPYQQAYTLEFAIETITRLTGARFDAKIVTAFLKACELGEIRPASQARRPEPVRQQEVTTRVASMT